MSAVILLKSYEQNVFYRYFWCAILLKILRGFYKDGQLSDELLSEYELDYLALGRSNDFGDSYEFPSDPVVNRNSLREHIRKQWRNPVKVVSVEVKRSVYRGQNRDGTTFDLGIKDAREGALKIYTPEGTYEHCFCQMCHQVKPYRLMEVNNIEILPKYYFPQLRVALCLECSKRFEYLRGNASIRDAFISAIKKASLQNQGTIDIEIGHDETITFTGKHLAEVQEILNQMPKKNK